VYAQASIAGAAEAVGRESGTFSDTGANYQPSGFFPAAAGAI
jgi:hypothetical protein